jgi:hypothetical protein
MDVDPPTAEQAASEAQAAAAVQAAAAALASSIQQREAFRDGAATRSQPASTGPLPNIIIDSEKVKKNYSPGSLFKQCSAAKLADRKVDILSTEAGPGFTTESVPVPRIGNMQMKGYEDLSSVYHGARLMRGGKQTNDVLTTSFDPATLSCLTCPKPHSILSKNSPSVICFTDQNCMPCLPNSESGTVCLAVVRLEDASLADLANLAMEIFETSSLLPGSVILAGSASHLFRSGVTTYAGDWVNFCNRLGNKFKNANVCPLIPFLTEDSPGALARDLEILTVWYHKVYNSSIKGFLEAWSCLLKYVKAASVGGTVLQYDDVQRFSLPKDLSSPGTDVLFFKFSSSCPVQLHPMDRKTISELLGILTSLLQTNFSIATSPEVNLPRAPPEAGGSISRKHIICIGSSIAKQTVPFLQALGYTVTDLTRPGWLATDENIASLIDSLSKLDIAPGFSILLDLLGNCAYRFVQFDGTLALPQKENGRYHLKGPVTCCTDDIFKKIIKSLAPVLLAAQDAVKISIPPLPRYVFNSCCNNTSHCSNLLNEGHSEKMLNGVTHLRGILKNECGIMGVRNHWILDGIGALCGTPVGQSGGSNRDQLPDLKNVLAGDGVHFKAEGYRNLAAAIVAAIDGVNIGILTKPTVPNSAAGTNLRKPREYFWRGFSSPIGDDVGRATLLRHQHQPQPVPHRGRQKGHYPQYHQQHQFHPYRKKF